MGLALGGPLLALLGAAWTSYSCTQEKSDAGEAARGTGKWAIGFYNFFAKVCLGGLMMYWERSVCRCVCGGVDSRTASLILRPFPFLSRRREPNNR